MSDLVKVGAVLYFVNEELNYFRRERLTFTDVNGVEWYSYSMPVKTYKLQKIEICGSITKIVEGEVDQYEDVNKQFFYRLDDDQEIYTFYNSDFPKERLFLNIEDAKVKQEELTEQIKVLESS